MKISRTATVVTVTVVLALAGVVGLGAYAFAQADGYGPPWGNGAPWHEGHRGWGGWRSGGPPDPEQVRRVRTDLAGDLGAQLDASAEDVEAAFRAVVAQRLQEAVEGGDLDQSDADEALAAYDDGDLPALFHVVKRDGREATEDS